MKKSIAVIFGGRSAEHDVSIITAHLPIIQSLLASGQFEVWPVYITTEGTWYCDQKLNEISFFQAPDVAENLKKLKPVEVNFTNGLTLIWPGLRPKTVSIDVAFPAMHETYGEDGSLMGLLRLANIPFVGCDLEASVIAMDKVLLKQVTEPLGIPSVPYVWFTTKMWQEKAPELRKEITKLSYPLFVKPVHLGSSIGITKVEKEGELENAIEVALHYDTKVIVEEGVTNLIEVTLPIIGNDELELAYVEQPLAEFFDFDKKYMDGGKGKTSGAGSGYSAIPARISDELIHEVEELGKRTYKAIGASGISRIDFLINGKTNKVYVNEVNTLPGILYHHNWRQKGVSGVELVTKLIRFAEERFATQKALAFTFRSDVLSTVSSAKLQNS